MLFLFDNGGKLIDRNTVGNRAFVGWSWPYRVGSEDAEATTCGAYSQRLGPRQYAGKCVRGKSSSLRCVPASQQSAPDSTGDAIYLRPADGTDLFVSVGRDNPLFEESSHRGFGYVPIRMRSSSAVHRRSEQCGLDTARLCVAWISRILGEGSTGYIFYSYAPLRGAVKSQRKYTS